MTLVFNPENENVNLKNYFYYFICKNCAQIPFMILEKNLDYAQISCDCHEGAILSYDEIKEKYLIDEEKFPQYFYCKFHEKNEEEENKDDNNDKSIIRYFCKGCKNYICKMCSYNHRCGKSNLNNMLIDLNVNRNKINDIMQKIENLLKPNNKDDISFDDNLDKWTTIISSINREYKRFPHINLAFTIINLYTFIINLDENEKRKNDINKSIEINDLFDYDRECKKKNIEFTKIIRINKKDFNILNFEADINRFKALEILDIQNNFISDISVLRNANLNNLKSLFLNINRLGNDQIDNIEHLNTKNLIELNLGTNLFTDYKIFRIISNFPKLESLDLSSNRLEMDSIDISKKDFGYDSVKTLILSNGVFSNENIHFISVLRFKSLEYLDLSSNNLNDMSFITKLNFGENTNKIKKLLLNYNNISMTELDEKILNDIFINLELLELKDNCTAKNKIKNSKFKIITFGYEDDIDCYNQFIDKLRM